MRPRKQHTIHIQHHRHYYKYTA